ncbi:MAG: AraC family transcriptional regulator [Pseudomonadota bacterium]
MNEIDSLIMNWRSALIGLVMVISILAIVRLLQRQVERPSVLWLAGFVGASIATTIPILIGFAGAYDIWPGLTFLPTQMTLLFGPLVFFHARTLMVEEPLGRLLWLLAPGVAYWFYQLGAFVLLEDAEAKFAFTRAFHGRYMTTVCFYASFAMTVGCLYATWRLRKRYLAWLPAQRSDDANFRPVWLTHLFTIGIPLTLLWALENIIAPLVGADYFDRYWADFFSLFLVYFIAVEALGNLHGPFPKMRLTEVPEEVPDRDLEGRDWHAEGHRMLEAIKANAWYLETNFSLSGLSRRVGMNQAYVSRALNQGIGESFSHVINKLRIDHAKSLIDQGEQTMLDIALASGFGSKASFNRAFKTHEGCTPSAYKDRRSA